MENLVLLLGLLGTLIAMIIAMRHFIKPLELAIVRLDNKIEAIDRKYDRKVDELRHDILMLSRDINRMKDSAGDFAAV